MTKVSPFLNQLTLYCCGQCEILLHLLTSVESWASWYGNIFRINCAARWHTKKWQKWVLFLCAPSCCRVYSDNVPAYSIWKHRCIALKSISKFRPFACTVNIHFRSWLSCITLPLQKLWILHKWDQDSCASILIFIPVNIFAPHLLMHRRQYWIHLTCIISISLLHSYMLIVTTMKSDICMTCDITFKKHQLFESYLFLTYLAFTRWRCQNSLYVYIIAQRPPFRP